MENVWDDTFFMKKALAEAQLALEKDEVPVGVVIVANNSIIARAHNLTEALTAHRIPVTRDTDTRAIACK